MKNVFSGIMFTCTPIASSSAATMGPTAATTMRFKPCRSSASRPKARATSRNRRTWGALVKRSRRSGPAGNNSDHARIVDFRSVGTRLSFGDVAANELRIEIEGPIHGFGRENTDLRARLRPNGFFWPRRSWPRQNPNRSPLPRLRWRDALGRLIRPSYFFR